MIYTNDDTNPIGNDYVETILGMPFGTNCSPGQNQDAVLNLLEHLEDINDVLSDGQVHGSDRESVLARRDIALREAGYISTRLLEDRLPPQTVSDFIRTYFETPDKDVLSLTTQLWEALVVVDYDCAQTLHDQLDPLRKIRAPCGEEILGYVANPNYRPPQTASAGRFSELFGRLMGYLHSPSRN